jgi:DNA polymerase III epsilon subunit-like protein
VKTVYFDFETGGVLETQPSIQLAAIVIDDATGEELANFERKIKFDPAACDPKALEINHYTEEAWKDAKPAPRVAAEFSDFIRPHLCIEMMSKRTGAPYYVAKAAGYNALTFDWPRLKALFATQFLPVSYHVRDCLQRAMWWFDEHQEAARPKDLKLSTVCEYFGIAVDGAHDALVDVRLTAALARRLANGK